LTWIIINSTCSIIGIYLFITCVVERPEESITIIFKLLVNTRSIICSKLAREDHRFLVALRSVAVTAAITTTSASRTITTTSVSRTITSTRSIISVRLGDYYTNQTNRDTICVSLISCRVDVFQKCGLQRNVTNTLIWKRNCFLERVCSECRVEIIDFSLNCPILNRILNISLNCRRIRTTPSVVLSKNFIVDEHIIRIYNNGVNWRHCIFS